MANRDHIVNTLLAVLVIALLAICVRSIVSESQVQTKKQEMRDGRE